MYPEFTHSTFLFPPKRLRKTQLRNLRNEKTFRLESEKTGKNVKKPEKQEKHEKPYKIVVKSRKVFSFVGYTANLKPKNRHKKACVI